WGRARYLELTEAVFGGHSTASSPQRDHKMHNELLVIEDAELHLSILRKIAEQVGFKTTGAHSVAEASELLHERTFDCITLDLSLGEDSGIEVLQLLAKMKCRTPVIVTSASGKEIC